MSDYDEVKKMKAIAKEVYIKAIEAAQNEYRATMKGIPQTTDMCQVCVHLETCPGYDFIMGCPKPPTHEPIEK